MSTLKNFSTWAKTVTGFVDEHGNAPVFDERIEVAYAELRVDCEKNRMVPTSVNQSFSTEMHDTTVLCVMTITAQLVSQEYMEAQQRAQMIQQNGFRR